MNILVTGGAGFIGSHLCKRLISVGNKIAVIDNLSNGTKNNIKELMGRQNFDFYECDINDTSKIDEIFRTHSFEMVYHLAANADVYKGAENYQIDLNNTLLTTVNVLEMMRKYDVKKLFFASSSTIYGKSEEPLRETGIEMRPISHYGAAKMAGEAFINSFSNLYGIQVWIARFCNVVGPNMTHGIIPDLIRKLKKNPSELEVYGDGTQTKPYIYIDDLLDGIMILCHNGKTLFNGCLVGVDSTISAAKIAEIIMKEMRLVVPVKYVDDYVGRKGDVCHYRYDVTCLKKLGWTPRYTSEDAVRLAIQLNLNN